jgi:hypothetical protein
MKWDDVSALSQIESPKKLVKFAAEEPKLLHADQMTEIIT